MGSDEAGASLKTVWHLRASNFVGGPERQVLRYCAGAGSDQPRQILAAFTGPGADNPEGQALLRAAREQDTETVDLAGGGWRDFGAIGRLRRALRDSGAALLCTHGYRADLLGRAAAGRAGVPVVSFLRGDTGENLKVRLYERAARAARHAMDRIVCLSHTQARQLPESLQAKVRIVVNAIEPWHGLERGEARRELAALCGAELGTAPLVAMAGRLSPEKGASLFLQMAARLHAAVPQARFLVLGDGVLRAQLLTQAQGLGLDAWVHFAGHVSDWTRLLAGLDLVVNPSWREQAPNVVLEAMAAGRPVVATRVGAVEEIAAGTAATVPAGDAPALATAAAGLLLHPARAAALGRQAQLRVQQHYSLARQQEQLQALFAEFVPAESPAPLRAWPTVSVVLPVRHEVAHLGRILEQLLQQDYPAGQVELLIADGGSDTPDDGTTRLAQAYAARWPGRVRWLPNPGRLASAGRNVGVQAGHGEWIVFVDGHCELPGSDWLRASMEEALRHGAACLSRPQPLTAGSGVGLQGAIARVRATRIAHGSDSTIYDARQRGWVNPSSSGAVYRRELFERFGGYDEAFDACEDVEFNHRLAQAGVRAWLCPEAVVFYAARTSLAGLWRQMVRYGRGRARLARKHADARSWAQVVPALWLASLPLALVLAAAGRGLWHWAGAVSLGLYLGIVLLYSLGLGLRHGWRDLLMAPGIFLTVHVGLGVGTWREALASMRPRPRADFVISRSKS